VSTGRHRWGGEERTTTLETDERERAGQLLGQHQATVLPAWTDSAASSLRGRLTRQELEVELGAIYASLAIDGDEKLDLDPARALLADLSRSRARLGFSPSETAVAVTSLKDPVRDLARAGTVDLDGYLGVADLVDELGLYTFEAYVKVREQVVADQAEQLLELSTPVIKLWEGVVAVPLVGTLDSARTQVVMENLLETLVSTGSEHAIIDITGVPAVDTQVAQHLLKTVMAARLMGAQCIVSGIRPQIAQTIVALGIEFGDIVTKATLADALVICLRSSGVEVVPRRERGSP
jgi:rsbT co-antagonist protein RsbR